MGYREAKNIRKKSFGTLLGEQEGGLGTSIKKAMSLKAKAKMTGIKETFDPMNIAKKLTFGSNLAPAIVGKMFGRKQEDIAHFTDGKVRGKDTASKLKPIDKEAGQDGMVDILTKILTLLQKTNEEDIKSKEKQNNYNEENEIEKEKKRKELLLALQNKNDGGKPAEKIKSQTGMGLGGIIADLLGAFGGITAGLNLLKTIGMFFMNPVTGGLLLGAASLGALFFAMYKASPEAHEQATKVSGAMDASSEGAAIMDVVANTSDVEKRKQQILASRPSSKKSMLFWKDPELQNKYLEEIGFDEKTGLTKAEKEQGYNALDANGLPTKKETTSAAPAAAATSAPTAAAVADSSSSSSSAPTASLSPNESVVSTAAPVASTNVGQKLNQAVSENNSAKLSARSEDPSTTVNNTTNVSSKQSSQSNNKSPILSVRNTEDTFQRMIMNSTRVV
jgi:hypothetical protein